MKNIETGSATTDIGNKKTHEEQTENPIKTEKSKMVPTRESKKFKRKNSYLEKKPETTKIESQLLTT